jgi:hypothetical protein
MTLEKMLRQQLNNSKASGFHVSIAGWDVTLVTDRQDSLSCALKELALGHAEPVREELRAWADRVADRATGLLEPLRLVEIDGPLGKALLRSETPAVQDGKAFYYELVLERTQRSTATLRRYAGDPIGGDKRVSVAFVLTHDAIVKLAVDIVGAN